MAKVIVLPNKRQATKKTKVGVIIQARMTSKRFPGKSMALLLGKPVIQHTIERAKMIMGVSNVILAVPDRVESEEMLKLADKLEIDNFLGAEHNVVKRYYDAATYFKLDVILRLTGDCPFIDPVVCEEVLALLAWRNLDYASNIHPTRTYPRGLDCEAFTMDCLEAASMYSELLDLEHVTPWMQRTKGIRSGLVQQKTNASDVNLCVDYPHDIKRIEDFIVGNTSIIKLPEASNDK